MNKLIENDYCSNCNTPLLYPEKPCVKCGFSLKNNSIKSKVEFNKQSPKFLLGFASVLLIIIICTFLVFKASPEYSIYQSIMAIKEGDIETVETYIDIDAILNNSFYDAMQESSQDEVANTFAIGIASLMKPVLVGLIESQIKYFIQNPEKYDFDTTKINSFNVLYGLMAKKTNKLKLEKTKINKITYVFILIDKEDDSNSKFTFKKSKNKWVLVGISPDLKEKYMNAQNKWDRFN